MRAGSRLQVWGCNVKMMEKRGKVGKAMVKIDLITGFLGSGKTTFLKKYAAYLMKQGKQIGILENDFGAVNVDMMLLQDMMGEQCDLEMIAGGCDADCHRRRFKTKLIAMGMCGYDRVLMEPSGIYDVDEFFDVLREEPLDRWYEIGSVIAVVDANLEEELSEEAEYLLATQLSNAGLIVLSKTKGVSGERMEQTIAHLNRALARFGCKRTLEKKEIVCGDWEAFTDLDYEKVEQAGYVLEDYQKLWFEKERTFTSLYFMNVRMDTEKLRETVKDLMKDTECGNVFRIKGFMRAQDDTWVELNATQKDITIQPIEKGQEVFIVIGEDLVEEKIAKYWEMGKEQD